MHRPRRCAVAAAGRPRRSLGAGRSGTVARHGAWPHPADLGRGPAKPAPGRRGRRDRPARAQAPAGGSVMPAATPRPVRAGDTRRRRDSIRQSRGRATHPVGFPAGGRPADETAGLRGFPTSPGLAGDW